MLALALDHVWSVLGISRARSMRRRLRAADRRISSLVDVAHAHSRDSFELEPWKFSVPTTVLVDLAAARGFVPESIRGEWELREPLRFVPGELGAGERGAGERGAGRLPAALSAPAGERGEG